MDRKTDSDGFDLIFVAWEHGNRGQKDGWTYPGHFDVVGHGPATPEDLARELAHEFGRAHTSDDQCPECGEKHTEEDRNEVFHNALQQAFDEAFDSEGFAMFYVKRTETNDAVEITPYIISVSLSEEAQALMEAQIIKLAGATVDRFLREYFKKFQ